MNILWGKNTMQIGEKVIEYIKRSGMTQKEFSERTGIPQSTISDWKRKKLNPSSDKILIICKTLEITPYELLGQYYIESDNSEFMVAENVEEQRLLKAYRGLDDENKARLSGYIDGLSE